MGEPWAEDECRILQRQITIALGLPPSGARFVIDEEDTLGIEYVVYSPVAAAYAANCEQYMDDVLDWTEDSLNKLIRVYKYAD